MNQSEVGKWAKALIAKMHVITGWVIPEDELLAILVDQFSKKMTESYADVNPDEVEYAFRNKGTTVKDWGKSMNLSLIDEVMIPYLSSRYEISQTEERQESQLLQIEYKEDMSKDAMNEWFNATAKKIRAGEMKVDFVPVMLYEFLNDRGGITATKEQKYEYLQRAAEYRQSQLQSDVEINDTVNTRWRLSTFITQKNNGCFDGTEATIVKELAKKICFFESVLNTPE